MKLMEICNIGIDITNIERFRKKEYAKNKKFYQKIFTDSIILGVELNYEFLVSVSHDANVAIAIVIALKK